MAEHFGWPSVFYVFGIVGLVWFGFWWVMITDKPEDDEKISQSELNYIKASLGAKDNVVSTEAFLVFDEKLWQSFQSNCKNDSFYRKFLIPGKPC